MMNVITEKASSISDYAIIVDSRDNVAVVKTETGKDLRITLPSQKIIEIKDAIPPGHRFATRAIPAGNFVCQYGQPIGTSLGIDAGEWISHENMSNDVPVVCDMPEDLHTPAPDQKNAAGRQ